MCRAHGLSGCSVTWESVAKVPGMAANVEIRLAWEAGVTLLTKVFQSASLTTMKVNRVFTC